MIKNEIDDLDYDDLDEDLDIDEEIDSEIDDLDDTELDSIQPKKKGRPKSDHYVKESDLRDEINLSKLEAERVISNIEKTFQDKLKAALTDPEKETITMEMEAAIAKANTKSYCTPRLGEIVVLTVDRVATQTKFRQYTYLDDMKAEAIYQSIRGITKFSLDKVNDLGQKSSSFSYLTQIITNAFRQILKKEKKNREIKDQAIEMALNEHSDVEVDFESIKRKKERFELGSSN